jgi:hypothetical protein
MEEKRREDKTIKSSFPFLQLSTQQLQHHIPGHQHTRTHASETLHYLSPLKMRFFTLVSALMALAVTVAAGPATGTLSNCPHHLPSLC